MSVLSFLAIFVFTQIEFAFLIDANDREDLVGFIATFYGGVFFFITLFKVLFSYRLIQKLGLLRSLLLLPAALIVVCIPGFFYSDAVTIFGFSNYQSVWIMLVWSLLYYSIHNPLFLALFQPLDKDLRLFGHTIVKGFINPIAMFFGACTVLFLVNHFNVGIGDEDSKYWLPIHLLIIVVSVLWVIAAIWVNQEYFQEVRKSIQNRWFTGNRLIQPEDSNLDLLIKNIKEGDPLEAIYSYELLERFDKDAFAEYLGLALDHPNSELCIYALQKLESGQISGMIDRILPMVENGPTKEIRLSAIRAYCIQEDYDPEQVMPLLLSTDVSTKKAAINGLIRRGDVESIVFAGQELLELINGNDPSKHLAALEVFQALGIRNFFRPIMRFFEADHHEIQRQAVLASASVSNPRFVPHLLKRIEHGKFRHEALQALVSIGDDAMDKIIHYLKEDHPSHSIVLLVRFLGKVGGDRAREFLISQIHYPNLRVRQEVLLALNTMRFRATDSEKEIFFKEVERSLSCCIQIQQAAADSSLSDDLRKALENDRKQHLRSILLMLSFIYHRETMIRAIAILLESHEGSHANVLENLEGLVNAPFKQLLTS
jgi:HEAT repeat protein